MLTDRFDRAVAYARIVHGDHVRKGTTVPYFSHLVQVCGLVLEFGGNEDEAIAALFHDAAEDRGGEARLRDIARQFGDEVASMVRENSDSLTDTYEEKASWRERKSAYLAAIPEKSRSACLVSICDKIHNARSLLSDQRTHGDAHWARFNASKADALWYYRSLVEAFRARKEDNGTLGQPLRELDETVRVLESA